MWTRTLRLRHDEAAADGDVLDLGGKRLRFIQTSHVPHNWESQVVFEETTDTLLCGDLLSQAGAVRPLTDGDILTRAVETEDMSMATLCPPTRGGPSTAWPSWTRPRWRSCTARRSTGACATVLRDLAGTYDRRIVEMVEQGRAGE